MTMRSRWLTIFAAMLLAPLVRADTAPFDLAGPTLVVSVTRAGQELGIAAVPNLVAGDALHIRADFPRSQSAHYLLVVAFLSGSTNPPPTDWFTSCKAWTRKCARDGLHVRVPADAQQVLVFLAPQTGGDLRTLIGAVRGRPGAFVRTAQDLNQAMLDRSRLDEYLATIRSLNDADPTKLKTVAPLLARSLAIVVDPKCLQLMPDLQASCLMAGRESLILQDGHSTSIVEALTSGPASDLAMQASYTPQLRFGYYSPYVASVLDIARIFDSFRTAQYQYVPALSTLRGKRIELTLNAAPSFNDPKTVLVAALPAVEPAQLPPLHAVDPQEIYCARKHSLVLPVEGAPLVFSTGYAHDMQLVLSGKDGKTVAVPARIDATQGGFVVDTSRLDGADLGDRVHGLMRGKWGFDLYDGPGFDLVNSRSSAWQVAPGDGGAVIVGRQDTVHLRADSVSCIDHVMLRDPDGKEIKVDWKAAKPGEVELKLPLQDAKPGDMTLLVSEYGEKTPAHVALQAFAAAGRFDNLTLYAGDATALLKGSLLDEVAGISIGPVSFVAKDWSSGKDGEELTLVAADPAAAAALVPRRRVFAQIHLKDGRSLEFKTTVLPPRPRIALIAKSVQPTDRDLASHVGLVGTDELPQDARLVFSVRTQGDARIGRDSTIEVGTVDGAFAASLTIADGRLTPENAHVAVASFTPLRLFGAAVFGPLQFRLTTRGASSDWQPLATIVRLPKLDRLECPATAVLACRLSGGNLFLIDSLAPDRAFQHPVEVPDGFPGEALPVPHPVNGRMYLKLRDDPAVVDEVALTAEQLPASPDEQALAAARHAASTAVAPAAAVTPAAPGSAPANAVAPAAAVTPAAPGSAPANAVAPTSAVAPAAAASPTAPESAPASAVPLPVTVPSAAPPGPG
ncbi:MAG: hypothetical protein KGL34_02835 [Gammaproteobacteria bacterium]|nr:hypothetical protein [Gammaproteobacteria bacterium]